MTHIPEVLGLIRLHGGRGGAFGILLLAGLVFAGLLLWAIQRSGRRAV